VDISDRIDLDPEDRPSADIHDARHMDAVVDRFVASRKHEKAIKAGIAAALLVGDGLLQIHVAKGAGKAESGRFYDALCSRSHHFVYGDIAPEYFVTTRSPDVRRPRRGQAHASGAAHSRSDAKHRRRLLRS
jgi:excinuclease ABC subunit A